MKFQLQSSKVPDSVCNHSQELLLPSRHRERSIDFRVLPKQTDKQTNKHLSKTAYKQQSSPETLALTSICWLVGLCVVIKPETQYFAPCVWREVITPGNGRTLTQTQTTCVRRRQHHTLRTYQSMATLESNKQTNHDSVCTVGRSLTVVILTETEYWLLSTAHSISVCPLT